MAYFTVKTADTAVTLSATAALKEVEKLAIYDIEAVVYDENGVLVDLTELRRSVGTASPVGCSTPLTNPS